MSSFQPVRGTHDLLPSECHKHLWIAQKAREIAHRFGCADIATPIFEFSPVFKRGLGDASDIVNKEMYTFEDRGGDEITLRPEGTAGVARAFVSHGLAQQSPLKFFYYGPMFRYERPQKGRQRQFHQFGVEFLGISNPLADIEVISLASQIFETLGLHSLVQLEVNSIGDTESRQKYKAAFVQYLTDKKTKLSEDSQRRLQTNPLRILDSKDPRDQELLKPAPLLPEFLNKESTRIFKDITSGLDQMEIKYTHNPQLVRGLDYYTHFVFEFKTQALGAQDAVLSGGRYDGLVELMGGPHTPAVGWASGVERLALLIEPPPSYPRPIALVPLGGEAETAVIPLGHRLRKAGLTVEIGYSGNLSKRMKKAHKLGAKVAVIIGSDELKEGQVTVKDLDSGAQVKMRLEGLEGQLNDFISKK